MFCSSTETDIDLPVKAFVKVFQSDIFTDLLALKYPELV